MEIQRNTFWTLLLVALEVAIITYLDYGFAGTYYSLDVLYCLPVVQAARVGAIRAMRKTDTQTSTIIGVISAVAWSAAEAAVIWPNYPLGAVAMNIFTRSVTFTVLGRVVARLWKEREYSRKDTLTNLANRLEFIERFEIEQLRSERSGSPYSLLYIDIDQFKKLNDNHGHQVGDEALKDVAGILRGNSRNVDTVARIGGDEFVLLFPETDEYVCGILVNRIKSVSEKKFKEEGWAISLSVGHTTARGKENSVEEVMHLADENMYLNKKDKQ
jgi:diguanylate cyclase (GGDEF)-like protein